MSIIRINYTKTGATFADGNAARADKNRLFPPELQQAVNDSDARLILNGTLTQEPEYFWDQSTYTYTRQLHVTSLSTYWATADYDKPAAAAAAEAAGWTFAGVIVVN